MRRTWSSRQRVITLVLLLGFGSVAAVKSTARCPMEVATEWAVAHPHDLPQTLDEITQYPDPYQRAIMRFLPVATRVQIWRDHFAASTRMVHLNDDQKRVLSLVSDSLGTWLGANVPPATLAKGGTTYTLMRKTFPDSLGGVFFASLGASGKGGVAIQTASMFSTANGLLSLATVQAGIRAVFGSSSLSKALAPVNPCDCADNSNWCSSGANCKTWVNCDVTHGCGTFFLWMCDGQCAF